MAENKPLSFKNFTEEDVELFKDSQTLDEVLSISGRRKKARDAKRRKMVLKIARKRAKRRMAKSPVLQKRARRSARKAVTDKILKGRKNWFKWHRSKIINLSSITIKLNSITTICNL